MIGALNFKHRLVRAPLIRDREEWILGQCKGRHVLHVGCVDAGMLDSKLDHGAHLHNQLADQCAAVIGVDINKAGIEHLKALGFENVLHGDLASEHDRIASYIRQNLGRCDTILCGEVLEHVLDMGRFLEGVRKVALAFDSRVIITVPNAYSFERFIPMVLGTEMVHPDHKCYFSQVTLKTLLNQTGFSAVGTNFYSNEKRASSRARLLAKRFINRTILAVWPQLATGLIAVAKAGR